MIIDGQEVVFLRSDGEKAQKAIIWRESRDGEMLFFELLDCIRPILNGKALYKRLVVRRVFPCGNSSEARGAQVFAPAEQEKPRKRPGRKPKATADADDAEDKEESQ